MHQTGPQDEPTPERLAQLIAQAWQRRDILHATAELNAYRIFHGWTEGCRGLEIDRYGDCAIIAYRSHNEATLPAAIDAVARSHAFSVIVTKRRRADPEVAHGALPTAGSIVVAEPRLRFHCEPWQPANPGLYLDARPARSWLLENSDGRRVLNLFAAAGSLGVAAAVGGARAVTHVDMQRRALERCRANHQLNNVAIDDRDLMRVNIYQHLRKNAAKRRRFSGIIIDPPPTPAPKDRTPGGRGLAALVPLAAPLLDPGGWLLCLMHHSGRSADEREAAIIGSAGVTIERIWASSSGIDFPEPDGRNQLHIAAFQRTA